MTPVNPDDAFGLLCSFLRHRGFVHEALTRVANEISRRAVVHDLSKMSDDEFAGFTRINAAARIHKFGSPEYREGIARERAVIDLHFSRNSHHPENPPRSFLDIIEMICDWWGARKGYDDPRSWRDTVKLNLEHKGKYLTDAQRWLAEQVADWFASTETPDEHP